jgi:hypothetical protein
MATKINMAVSKHEIRHVASEKIIIGKPSVLLPDHMENDVQKQQPFPLSDQDSHARVYVRTKRNHDSRLSRRHGGRTGSRLPTHT